MYRKSWDVQDLIGQHAQVRLVDETSGGWGHINFDDLKGNIVCPHNWHNYHLQGFIRTLL